ncbi:MAG: hypothetical protein RLZZ557_1775, partial [Bacteroidota bacterium]
MNTNGLISKMKKIKCSGWILVTALTMSLSTVAQTVSNTKMMSGNPLFPGWYADPEAVIFDNTYWIYPTYSAPYDKQVFMDA